MSGQTLPDWSPTRDPKKNAEIEAKLRAERRVDAGIAEIHRRRMEKLPHAAEHAGTLVIQYLDEWALWVNTAIGDVSIPADKDGKIWWWIALAGNLVWAATIFINPAAAGGMLWIKIMSVSGGIVGAGGLESSLSSSSPSPPIDENVAKDRLRKSVARARAKLETHFNEKRFDWAGDFWRLADWDQNNPAVKDSFDKFIWEKMFPWIPHDDDRFEQIRNEAARMAKSVMGDFLCQWKTYLNSDKWAGEAEMAKYAAKNFHPKLTFSFGGQLFRS